MTDKPKATSLREAIKVTAVVDVLTRVAGISARVLTARTLEPAEIGTLGLVVATMAIVSMLGGHVEAGALVASDAMDDSRRAGVGGVLRLIVVIIPLFLLFGFQERLVNVFLDDPATRLQAHAPSFLSWLFFQSSKLCAGCRPFSSSGVSCWHRSQPGKHGSRASMSSAAQ